MMLHGGFTNPTEDTMTTNPAGFVRLRTLAQARLEQAESSDASRHGKKFALDSWQQYIADIESDNPSHDGDCEKPYRPHICNCKKRTRERTGLTEWTDGELIFTYPECPRCGNETDGDGDSYSCDTCSATFSGAGKFLYFYDDMGDLMDVVDRAAVESALGVIP